MVSRLFHDQYMQHNLVKYNYNNYNNNSSDYPLIKQYVSSAVLNISEIGTGIFILQIRAEALKDKSTSPKESN